eukprot:gene8427-9288_t
MLSARFGPFIVSSGSTLALITMTSLSVFTARACRYLSSHPVLSHNRKSRLKIRIGHVHGIHLHSFHLKGQIS